MTWEVRFKLARQKANAAYEAADTPYEAAGAYLAVMQAFSTGNYPPRCDCVLPSQSCVACEAAMQLAHGEEIPF